MKKKVLSLLIAFGMATQLIGCDVPFINSGDSIKSPYEQIFNKDNGESKTNEKDEIKKETNDETIREETQKKENDQTSNSKSKDEVDVTINEYYEIQYPEYYEIQYPEGYLYNDKGIETETETELRYFYVDSNGELKLKMEIGDIPKECAQDAINEMYAVKGYRFKQEPYKTIYAKFNGYIENMEDVQFSKNEKAILDKLIARR